MEGKTNRCQRHSHCEPSLLALGGFIHEGNMLVSPTGIHEHELPIAQEVVIVCVMYD